MREYCTPGSVRGAPGNRCPYLDITSCLRLVANRTNATPQGFVVSWASQPDRLYAVDRTTNLVSNKIFVNLQSSISGRTGITSFKDTTAIGPGPYYYRVRLQQ